MSLLLTRSLGHVYVAERIDWVRIELRDGMDDVLFEKQLEIFFKCDAIECCQIKMAILHIVWCNNCERIVVLLSGLLLLPLLLLLDNELLNKFHVLFQCIMLKSVVVLRLTVLMFSIDCVCVKLLVVQKDLLVDGVILFKELCLNKVMLEKR